MPGYLNHPVHTEATLEAWTKNNGTLRRKYLINILKAFYGDAATPENDFAYAWLPKRNAAKDYNTYSIFERALDGYDEDGVDGGAEPGGHRPQPQDSLRGASASWRCWWSRSCGRPRPRPSGRRPGADPKSIQTEVLLLPAAFFMEKNGSISNSGGDGSVAARGGEAAGPGQGRRRDCGLRLPPGPRPGPRLEGTEGRDHQQGLLDVHHRGGRPARDQRARGPRRPGHESQGRDAAQQDGRHPGRWVHFVRAHGSTPASSATARTCPSGATHEPTPGDLGLYPNFGWTWPNNMRVLYNRASCDWHGSRTRAASPSSGGTSRRSSGRVMTCPMCRC